MPTELKLELPIDDSEYGVARGDGGKVIQPGAWIDGNVAATAWSDLTIALKNWSAIISGNLLQPHVVATTFKQAGGAIGSADVLNPTATLSQHGDEIALVFQMNHNGWHDNALARFATRRLKHVE